MLYVLHPLVLLYMGIYMQSYTLIYTITHTHTTSLFTVLILRKKRVYISFCDIVTALNSLSSPDRAR